MGSAGDGALRRGEREEEGRTTEPVQVRTSVLFFGRARRSEQKSGEQSRGGGEAVGCCCCGVHVYCGCVWMCVWSNKEKRGGPAFHSAPPTRRRGSRAEPAPPRGGDFQRESPFTRSIQLLCACCTIINTTTILRKRRQRRPTLIISRPHRRHRPCRPSSASQTSPRRPRAAASFFPPPPLSQTWPSSAPFPPRRATPSPPRPFSPWPRA